jgi:hypothetical protein
MHILGTQTGKLPAGQPVGLNVFDPGFDLTFGGGCELHPMRTHKSGISPSRIRFTRGGAGALN